MGLRGKAPTLGEPIALTVRQCVLGYHLTQDIAYPSGSPQRPFRKRCGRTPSPKPISLGVSRGEQFNLFPPAGECLGALNVSRSGSIFLDPTLRSSKKISTLPLTRIVAMYVCRFWSILFLASNGFVSPRCKKTSTWQYISACYGRPLIPPIEVLGYILASRIFVRPDLQKIATWAYKSSAC